MGLPEKKRAKLLKMPTSTTPDPNHAEQGGINSTEDPHKRKPFQRVNKLTGGETMRTLKIRMWPTTSQTKELKRCFDVARLAYNTSNQRVKGGEQPNFIKLRTHWRTLQPPAFANTPSTKVSSNIQARAIKQLVDAYSTNLAKKRKNPHLDFEVKDRHIKNNATEVIVIEKDSPLKKTSTLLRFEPSPNVCTRKGHKECLAFFGNNLKDTGGIRMQDRSIQRLLDEGNRLKEDAKILWDKRINAFFFIYTYVQPAIPKVHPQQQERIVATDPGNTPFQAWYSPTSGEHGYCLQGAERDLLKRNKTIDTLKKRIKGPNNGSRRTRCQRRNTRLTLRRKLAREQRRLHGWVENAHYDTANFLLSHHDIVIQPKLAVSRLVVNKATRCIPSVVARTMITWSHFLFRQRLKSAAARYPERIVIESIEPGTSKTCTNCGHWKANLGAAKLYVCDRCGIHVDRQLAGARNNFLAAYGIAIGVLWDGCSSSSSGD